MQNKLKALVFFPKRAEITGTSARQKESCCHKHLRRKT